ncbi:MAG: hypothetical protein WCP35_07525 [Verrucomicrobiota bacterium]
MKPGYQTTEFWLTLAAASASGGLGYLQTLSAPWAVASVTVLTALYTLLRASLKNKTAA